jgi:hypothetical protein
VNPWGRQVRNLRAVERVRIEVLHANFLLELTVGCNDALLTHEDGSPVSQPRKNWYALCVSCGLCSLDERGHYQGLLMYGLRRSAVRQLVSRGVPEKICHKTRSMFDRYNITRERDLETRLLEGQAPDPRPETDTSGFARA